MSAFMRRAGAGFIGFAYIVRNSKRIHISAQEHGTAFRFAVVNGGNAEAAQSRYNTVRRGGFKIIGYYAGSFFFTPGQFGRTVQQMPQPYN